jgi:hypothetical protein
VTQLIAEQTLVLVHIGVETKGSKWAAAFREEVPNTARDQDSNEVVVKRPPSLVAARHGHADEANRIVDHCSRECERAPESVARDDERHLRPGKNRGPARQHGQLGAGQSYPSVPDDLRYLIESTARVADRLAPDSRGSGSSKIGPERLAVAATQVVGVMVRQDQDPSAKPVLREETERPLVKVRAQHLAGQRRRQGHLLRTRPEE